MKSIGVIARSGAIAALCSQQAPQSPFRCLVSLIVLLSLVGCSGYQQTLGRVTKSGKVYDPGTLSAKVIWKAVLVTDAMREARITREAQLRHVSPEEAARYIPEQWNGQGTVFYVDFYGPKQVNDLDRPGDYWHFELRDNAGNVYAPRGLMKEDIRPLERKLFPFLSPWSKAYLVWFPEVVGNRVALTLYGLGTSSTLKWKL